MMRRNITSDKSGGVLSGVTANELKNSRSTAASRQPRKEVFSKKRMVNEHGISYTQRQAFKSNIPLSQTSSKAFTGGNLNTGDFL